jgi:serpin B
MKTMLRCAWVLFITVSMIANSRSTAGEADAASVSKGANQFAFDLYSQLRAKDGNLFLSPYSISTALAMTYAGARTATAQEMAKVLHFALPQEQLHPAYAALISKVTPENAKGYQLSVANALWGKQGYAFEKEFLNTTKTHYGAELTPIDTSNGAGAARQINQWVEEKTNQKIKDLVPPDAITPLTRLVLTNAIYFKGDWATQFKKEATRDGAFFISAGKEISVPLMLQKASFKFSEDEQLKILELPYVGEQLSMLILLPEKVDGLAELERTLTSDSLAKLSAGMSKQEVVVTLPKFKMTSQFDLGGTLVKMGMEKAFDQNLADFSGMTGGKEDIYISKVIHKAFVDVNEEGTEAAAATAVIMKARGISRTPVFKADHPFLFMIRHNATNTILFMGRVADPRS